MEVVRGGGTGMAAEAQTRFRWGGRDTPMGRRDSNIQHQAEGGESGHLLASDQELDGIEALGKSLEFRAESRDRKDLKGWVLTTKLKD